MNAYAYDPGITRQFRITYVGMYFEHRKAKKNVPLVYGNRYLR